MSPTIWGPEDAPCYAAPRVQPERPLDPPDEPDESLAVLERAEELAGEAFDRRDVTVTEWLADECGEPLTLAVVHAAISEAAWPDVFGGTTSASVGMLRTHWIEQHAADYLDQAREDCAGDAIDAAEYVMEPER